MPSRPDCATERDLLRRAAAQDRSDLGHYTLVRCCVDLCYYATKSECANRLGLLRPLRPPPYCYRGMHWVILLRG